MRDLIRQFSPRGIFSCCNQVCHNSLGSFVRPEHYSDVSELVSVYKIKKHVDYCRNADSNYNALMVPMYANLVRFLP